MGEKMTPAETVTGLAATLAFCFMATAMVWKWPDSSTWILSVLLILFAVFLFFFYRAVRKKDPNN